jgi:hypothetical protein
MRPTELGKPGVGNHRLSMEQLGAPRYRPPHRRFKRTMANWTTCTPEKRAEILAALAEP